MQTLSDVTILLGQRVEDLEAAQDLFCSEIAQFVSGVASEVKKLPPDTFVSRRVKLERFEIENVTKSNVAFADRASVAFAEIRFKREMKFVSVGLLGFGIEHDPIAAQFSWSIDFSPGERYQRLDDALWARWRAGSNSLPGSFHHAKENIVHFVSRPLSAELSRDQALQDLKVVFDFIVTAEDPMAEAVGGVP